MGLRHQSPITIRYAERNKIGLNDNAFLESEAGNVTWPTRPWMAMCTDNDYPSPQLLGKELNGEDELLSMSTKS